MVIHLAEEQRNPLLLVTPGNYQDGGPWMTYFEVLLFFQDDSHVKFLPLGQKVSKSLPRKEPTQSISQG